MAKGKTQKGKVAIKRDETIAISDGHPAFSFRYMTTASNYTFGHFGKDKHNAHAAYESLYDRLCDISRHEWSHWYGLSRTSGGIEMINAHQLRFSPTGYNMLDDDKVITLRFFHGDYRIIGFRQKGNNTLLIIGFDFDHTAYDHG